MEPLVSSTLVLGGFCLLVVSIVVSHFLSNRWIWISICSGILAGLVWGITLRGIPLGLLYGIGIGLGIDAFIVTSGLITKYYRKKGLERIQKLSHNKNENHESQ